MNPQEPTNPNMQSTEPSTQKDVSANQPTQQSTPAPASQATVSSQTAVNTAGLAATNQTKKSPVLNKGVIIGLIVFAVLLVAGAAYWFLSMQQ